MSQQEQIFMETRNHAVKMWLVLDFGGFSISGTTPQSVLAIVIKCTHRHTHTAMIAYLAMTPPVLLNLSTQCTTSGNIRLSKYHHYDQQ